MIEGAEITDLEIIEDERGSVRHMLRRDDTLCFDGFGEIYFSTVKAGAVKAWHLHKKMTLNYACVRGEVIVGLVDLREDSSTFGEKRWIYLADSGQNYRLLTIPPGVWNGFRVSENSQFDEAWIANLASIAHDPDEIIRVLPREFPVVFNWGPFEVAG